MTDQTATFNDAVTALTKKDYARATALLKNMLVDTEDAPEQTEIRFRALAKLAGHHSLMGEFDQAEKLFRDAEALASKFNIVPAVVLAEFFYEFGFMYDQQSKDAESIEKYNLAKSKFEIAASENSDYNCVNQTLYIRFLTCYAQCASRLDLVELAMKLYQEVLPLTEQTFGVTDNRSRLLRSNFVKLLEKVGGNSEAAQILKREEMQLSGVTPRIALISLHDSIKALQSMGLIRDVQQLSIPEKSTTENKEDVNIYELLLAYYGAREKGWERAEQDGFICHNYNYRKETNDLPAELCALIGQPILQQISFKDRADAQGNSRNCLGLRRDDGVGISIAEPNMEDIVELFNSVLKERDDRRRFFLLRSDDTTISYFLLTIDEAQELSNVRALEFEAMHRSLEPDITRFEKFNSWPGEVKPKHLKRFECEGDKLINGRYLINHLDGGANLYDIGEWPPKLIFQGAFDLATSFECTAGGDVFFLARGKTLGFSGFKIFIQRAGQPITEGVWMENSGDSEVGSKCAGHFVDGKLIVFKNRSHTSPRIENAGRLVTLPGITPANPEQFELDIHGGICTLHSNTTILMWNSIFYKREREDWTEVMNLRPQVVRELLVPFGPDGFICLIDACPHLIELNKEPLKLMDEQFMHLNLGPAESVILRRPDSWKGGGRDLLLFPKTGRTIELDLEIFGTPDSNLKAINFQPSSELIIGTTWDEIVAFPSAQAI
jgi:hypothetical protein